MERRRFIKTGATVSTVPFATAMGSKFTSDLAEGKELYELRTYTLRFGGNLKLLSEYLKKALQPAMKRVGANHFMVFSEVSNTLPRKLRVLISYPDANTYLQAQMVDQDEEFVKMAQVYNDLPVESPIYTRFSSWLLLAFDGLPKMLDPVDGATIFELRTYEGYSEDAVRRKIKMFNDEELPLFYQVGLNPIFFGDMIAGPHRPCLTYMLNYKDMEAHGKAWQAFLSAPAWNEMKVKEEYANTVSNIRNVFLELIS